MNQIIEEIFRFIFVFIIATFLCWTGEIIITATTFGWHRPRWDGYKDKPPLKRVACEVGVGALGFTPSMQKSLGRQSQGGKGAAVVIYCKPLPTRDLAP
jgi:hypothetical protein